MNFRIIKIGTMTRKDMLRSFFRWLLYAVLLLAFLVIQTTLPFIKWQPLLTISLAVAVAMFEGELSGVIFAVFAGMVTDMAIGGLFGFTSIWLVPCCLMVTLLSVNLIHRNIINYFWLNICVLVIVEFMELLFKYIIWRNPDIDIIILRFMLPSMIATVVLSLFIFLLVRLLNKKLGNDTTDSEIVSVFDDARPEEK
ncbi:MAG: hypothetical protein J1E39_00280 [Eubacterium sp.]|nr:hypothetical protein [Eubacterium sp.]